jgi:heterodisulfide reductase subunit C
MDYTPRQLIAMVRAGMRDQVLSSNAMWYCMSCYLCTVRCPRGIKHTDLMYVLKNLSAHSRLVKRGNRPLAMARSFVDVVNRLGRVHEASLIALYYLRTNPLKAVFLTSVGLNLFGRGRLPLLPHSIQNKAQLQAIVHKAQELGGA